MPLCIMVMASRDRSGSVVAYFWGRVLPLIHFELRNPKRRRRCHLNEMPLIVAHTHTNDINGTHTTESLNNTYAYNNASTPGNELLSIIPCWLQTPKMSTGTQSPTYGLFKDPVIQRQTSWTFVIQPSAHDARARMAGHGWHGRGGGGVNERTTPA